MDKAFHIVSKPVRRVVVAAAAASALAVAGLAVTAPAHAQGKPAAKPAGKMAGKPAAGAKAAGRRRTPQEMAKGEFARLEKITGKPLTDAQKKTLIAALIVHLTERKAADDKFTATAAKTVGMTPDALTAKYKELRASERGKRPGAPAGAPVKK